MSEVTNKVFANSKIYITVYKTAHFGSQALTETIDSKKAITDSQGNFSCKILLDNDPSTVVRFEKPADKLSGGLIKNAEFGLTEIKQSPKINLLVRQYTDLKIGLKNTIPFDANDAISIYYLVLGSSDNDNPVDTVINYGLSSQPYSPPAFDNGKNLYWVGKNVNSLIAIKIQESTTFQIFWSVKKNNIVTEFKSAIFNTSMSSINYFDIQY